jgi:hypothetical protein
MDEVNRAAFFGVEQKWLRRSDDPSNHVSSKDISEFFISLIEQTKQEVDQVHGLILPELALSSELAKAVAEELRRKSTLEIFITGALSNARGERGPQNRVYGWILPKANSEKRVSHAALWKQAKHHRWKVEQHQVRRYHLGGRLDPHIDWWEHIDISPRRCSFVVFRHEACLTALVCEDLARIDPVQTVIRSIGPNLVIALLMDGPQTPGRWSDRYATVLADDPGCAVITLTSLGLLRRWAMPQPPSSFQIALWKEAGGERARELSIPSDHHALLLTLSYKTDTCFTIDGRPDVNRTVALSLSGTHPIKCRHRLPSWLDCFAGNSASDDVDTRPVLEPNVSRQGIPVDESTLAEPE